MSKKWHGIVERSTDPDTIQHWYFSPRGDVWFISGYRRYERQPDGTFIIAARYYPFTTRHLPNVIYKEDVPLPPDVSAEVAVNTLPKEAYLNRALAKKIQLGAKDRAAALEDIALSIENDGLYGFAKGFMLLDEEDSASAFALQFFEAYNSEVGQRY